MTRPGQAITLLSHAHLRRLYHTPGTNTSVGACTDSWPARVPWQSDSFRSTFQDCSVLRRNSAADAEPNLNSLSDTNRQKPDVNLSPCNGEITEGISRHGVFGYPCSTAAVNTVPFIPASWILGQRQRRPRYCATRIPTQNQNHQTYVQQMRGSDDLVNGGSWDKRIKAAGRPQMLHRNAGHAPCTPVNFATLALFGSNNILKALFARPLYISLRVRNYAAPIPVSKPRVTLPRGSDFYVITGIARGNEDYNYSNSTGHVAPLHWRIWVSHPWIKYTLTGTLPFPVHCNTRPALTCFLACPLEFS